MSERIVIIGASGHAKVAAEVADLLGFEVFGFLDDFAEANSTFLGKPVLGGKEVLAGLSEDGVNRAFIGIGSTTARRQFSELITEAGLTAPTLIHPSATVSASAEVDAGVLICASAVVNPGAVIGAHSIVNTGAIVDHDCQLGRFVHIAPGATLAGNVTVQEGAWIGVGATVRDDVSIGCSAMIGAGAVVVADVGPDDLQVGVPARSRKRTG